MTSDQEDEVFEALIKSIVIELNKPVVDFKVILISNNIASIKQVSTGLRFYIFSQFHRIAKKGVKLYIDIPKIYKSHASNQMPVGISADEPISVIAENIKNRFLDEANKAFKLYAGKANK